MRKCDVCLKFNSKLFVSHTFLLSFLDFLFLVFFCFRSKISVFIINMLLFSEMGCFHIGYFTKEQNLHRGHNTGCNDALI